jgi:hypothetical protein
MACLLIQQTTAIPTGSGVFRFPLLDSLPVRSITPTGSVHWLRLGRHANFAYEIVELTLNMFEETSGRSTVTATENEPVLFEAIHGAEEQAGGAFGNEEPCHAERASSESSARTHKTGEPFG